MIIDRDSIERYQSIKAPERIKEKIERLEHSKKQRTSFFNYKTYAGLVASCALVLGIYSYGQGQSVNGLIIQQQVVDSNPICVSQEQTDKLRLARMEPFLTIPIELEQDQNVQLKVSGGVLEVTNTKGLIVKESQKVTKSENESVNWKVPEQSEAKEYLLTVVGKKETLIYRLYQEKTSQLYYIKLSEKEKTK